ncbi:MAG: DMT family transporter [Acetobacteraceae bacterium]|nr:DMT family transporter [Acetobacteraceae bacterium]
MRAPAAPRRPDTAGLVLLVTTAIGWGLNWPVMKALLAVLPPFSARAWAGIAGSLMLAAIARGMGERLAVPRALWGRLALIAALNVTSWMGLATLSLLWLSAGEGTMVCYTVPIWAALLAWPVLGERPTARRAAAILLALAGLVALVAGEGLGLGLAKLPGVALGLGAAVLFALGTVLTKRRPLALDPLASAAWQVGLGCAPLLLPTLLLERPDWAALPASSWASLAYMAAGPLGLCYIAWFAALRRLDAGVAAVGTLIAPVVGVLAGAVALGEPLGLREVAALALILGGVLLAVRG